MRNGSVVDALRLLLLFRCVVDGERRTAIAVVCCYHYDSVTCKRPADVRVCVPCASQSVGKHHNGPSIGLRRGSEEFGVLVYGHGNVIE